MQASSRGTETGDRAQPRLVVFTTLFPHPGQPAAGLFIRERMFRVGQKIPLVVVSPVPWFPLQGLVRLWQPHYRPPAPRREVQDGFDVHHPKFLAIPGLLRGLDGLSMALGSWWTMSKIRRRFAFNVIDAHFAYPDGYAATLLGRWFEVPVTITLRGTEVPMSLTRRRDQVLKALRRATQLFTVADALRNRFIGLGIDPRKFKVVGNGVDTDKFHPVVRAEARRNSGIPLDAKVLITVGGLVERKGFHRVIELLPRLLEIYPDLVYLVVGGASAEGDWSEHLHRLVGELGLERHVRFLGQLAPEKLNVALSSADVFVLPTRNEGWANVILEAMACGVPVVATDVGGNAEVINDETVGMVVPFGDAEALYRALNDALAREWDTAALVAYAGNNSWDERVDTLTAEFTRICA